MISLMGMFLSTGRESSLISAAGLISVIQSRSNHSSSCQLRELTGAVGEEPHATEDLRSCIPRSEGFEKHLDFMEEVKKRDHRKIGKDLDLFSTHEDVGAGLIYWHPKGARLRNTLEEWWRKEHFKTDTRSSTPRI